jgi:hypothetical protein
MSNSNFDRTPITPEVPPTGNPTDTDDTPDTPERPRSLVALESFWNNPHAWKLVLLAGVVLVFLVASVIHYGGKQGKEKAQSAAEGTTTFNNFSDFGRGDGDAKDSDKKIRIRKEVLGDGDGKGSAKKTSPAKGPGVVNPDHIEIPPARPEPPKYLMNPAVDYEFSWNHPDAVTSDSEIVTGGFSNLPTGKKAWLVRRFAAEAKAYLSTVEVAWQKFQDLGYWGRPFVEGKKQFDVAYIRLAAVQERLRAYYLTDTECALILEHLKSAVQFLNRLNEHALRRTPVTIPDFTEDPNPAWAEWNRKRNSRKAR